MPDQILQLKPNLHGIGIDLRALIKRLGPNELGDPLVVMADRFLKLFAAHGIQITQIPRIVPAIRYMDLATNQTLIESITPAVVDTTAALFGVRPEWIAGLDDRIYEISSCYQSPNGLAELLASRKLSADHFPVRAIATSKNLDRHARNVQRLEFVLVDRSISTGGVTFVRYVPISDGWDWTNQSCRIKIKAMVRLSRLVVPLYAASQQDVEALYDGRLFPSIVIHGPLITNPSLEDYVKTPSESVVAKEVDELSAVEAYIRRYVPTNA